MDSVSGPLHAPTIESLSAWWNYDARARQVYWNSAFQACRAKGPRKAVCLLDPGHVGEHYGNGYDVFGPMAPERWKR